MQLSKDKVEAALSGKSYDIPPLGLYAVDHEIVSQVIGRKSIVRNQVEMQLLFWEGLHQEVAERWKEDLSDFYTKIDCADIITCREAILMPPKECNVSPLTWVDPRLERNSLPVPRKIADNLWEDCDGRVYKCIPEKNEVFIVDDPTLTDDPNFYTEKMVIEGLQNSYSTSIDAFEFEIIDYIIEKFGDSRFIIGPSGGRVIMAEVGGFVTSLMLHALSPNVIKTYNAETVRLQSMLDEQYIRKGQDACLFDQDTGGTIGPHLSKEMFDMLDKPYMKQRISQITQFVEHVFMHNCGNNRILIPSFIEAGISCYQSLQTTAGMDLEQLSNEFASELIFWGGVPLELLIDGTPELIEGEVTQLLERMAGKPFILGPSQSIAMGTSYDNFMAMIDAYTMYTGSKHEI